MRSVELDDRTISDAVEILTYGAPLTARSRYVRTYDAGRVDWSAGAREIYSYGSHFPLGRYVPRRGRQPALWVVNGDVWRNGGGPSRTAEHQDSMRRAVASTGLETIILPFSAVLGAGIILETIRPVQVRPDEEWTETLEVDTLEEIPQWRRDNGPDHWRGYSETPQGRYVWEEARHRLGDALFTAERETTIRRMPNPGETALAHGATFRERELCERNPYAPGDGSGAFHVADETRRACVFCQRQLSPIGTTRRTRARYLSSFDYNENPPLYFLAQVPRGAGADTVDAAIDALAPRAVHAARARGKDVLRQGDIFLIPTGLTRADLEARGATFARLTQWTRDARPRKGEAGYRAPLDAAGRRREKRYRARLWREIFRGAVARATSGEISSARPQTPKGARRTWAKARAEHRAKVDAAQTELRRAILGGRVGRHQTTRYSPRSTYSRGWGPSALQQERDALARNARDARERVDYLLARGPRVGDAWNRGGYTSRANQRDFYRRQYGTNARAAYVTAAHKAAERYRPNEVDTTARRAAARRTLAIYGTAHAATETARVPGGYFYARGTVSHVPDLEEGRDGGRDHAPLTLAENVWYLAVRNAVPRQS